MRPLSLGRGRLSFGGFNTERFQTGVAGLAGVLATEMSEEKSPLDTTVCGSLPMTRATGARTAPFGSASIDGHKSESSRQSKQTVK